MTTRGDALFWTRLRETLRDKDLEAFVKLTERHPDEPVLDLFRRVLPELKGDDGLPLHARLCSGEESDDTALRQMRPEQGPDAGGGHRVEGRHYPSL